MSNHTVRDMFIMSLFPGWFQMLIITILGSVCGVALTFILFYFKDMFFEYDSVIGITAFLFLAVMVLIFWITMLKTILMVIRAIFHGTSASQLKAAANEASGSPTTESAINFLVDYERAKKNL